MVATKSVGMWSRLYCCCYGRISRQSTALSVARARKRGVARVTYPKITDVRERIRVARVVHVHNDVREVGLLRVPERLRLVLRAELLQLRRVLSKHVRIDAAFETRTTRYFSEPSMSTELTTLFIFFVGSYTGLNGFPANALSNDVLPEPAAPHT